jgi:ubiquinone/menaquinone biosynthesis C-methylase UbiE
MDNVYSQSEAASHYDAARSLPPQTKALWLETLKSCLPDDKVKVIVDLGCGTGRFTTALAESFHCSVIGIDPSLAMLDVARSQDRANICWKQGRAELIPLEDASVDVVFMSQVFHHLVQPQEALQETRRVLRPGGYLIIRNGTQENNAEMGWLHCFPEALEIEEKRMPSQKQLADVVAGQAFDLISGRTVYQFFAASYGEYFEKISQRGLSALIMIDDAAFQAGLRRLHDWVCLQPPNAPVREPVDLFVFRKQAD